MNKQELYNKAKEAYYNGNPIMSDEEFDNLEKEVGVGSVGYSFEYKGDKVKHPTRMLSLSKYQADKTTGAAPTEQALSWMRSLNLNEFEVTCKYDGNSGNIIYENGKLVKVLSRGDGEYGRDITEKVRNIIPDTISFNEGICEVRGEIIMKNSVFNEKYSSTFANPRNLVAGILGRDDNAMIDDLCFVAYDCKYSGSYHSIDEINSLGFNKNNKVFNIIFNVSSDNFDNLFDIMVGVRKSSDFPLDGFVLKAKPEYRDSIGENDHDPDWGKAIKFKPEGVTTEIVGVTWSIGKTGEFTPVANLKPVDLDGSTVSNASLYNAGYIESNDISVGTRVRLVKSGDIIPQIVEIFKH